jgi:hypothetical protein
MKAVDIISELREKYCKKYRMTPDYHKGHYISWLQDEYAKLAMDQANDSDIRTESKLHTQYAKRSLSTKYLEIDKPDSGGYFEFKLTTHEGREAYVNKDEAEKIADFIYAHKL